MVQLFIDGGGFMWPILFIFIIGFVFVFILSFVILLSGRLCFHRSDYNLLYCGVQLFSADGTDFGVSISIVYETLRAV